MEEGMRSIINAASRPSGSRVRRGNPPTVRFTRRGRIVLVAAVAAALLGVLWLGTRSAVTASSGSGSSGKGLPWVTVRQGDTLWDIAIALGDERDPASTIRMIMNLNGLSDSFIQPGERLYLPSRL
jgi:hypothetical protein